jgi:hypothetical protein
VGGEGLQCCLRLASNSWTQVILPSSWDYRQVLLYPAVLSTSYLYIILFAYHNIPRKYNYLYFTNKNTEAQRD